MKEVEQARGRKVVNEHEASFVSSTTANGTGDATTAEAVVSGRLVLFRTIEELQQRNRELLAVVRELSEQKELEEQVRSLGNSSCLGFVLYELIWCLP